MRRARQLVDPSSEIASQIVLRRGAEPSHAGLRRARVGRILMGAELLAWRITIYDGAEGGTAGKVVRRGHIRARAANEVVTIAAIAISGQISAVTMVAEPIPEDEGLAPAEPFVVVWEN